MNNRAYTVTVSNSAQKEIKALEHGLRVRVVLSLRSLAGEPRPSGCRKLVGSQNRWRVRVGDYRVIYTVDDAGRVIEIVAVRHRSKAYG
ncbi:MAG TPA: type II toxin-antitoxin system RelE/ParE family toxin [Pyrinomonadaceae bacterium]|nr:type II toxin-antitoxin system RelE/ParE family toxin [Pyrinomonadaceae bacterium]